MHGRSRRTIELRAYTAVDLPPSALTTSEGEAIWHSYGHLVDVAFPSPQTQHQWRLTAQGWVGHLPISDTLHLLIQPRLPLSNLWRMMAYAYNLDSLQIWPEVVQSDAWPAFFEQLATLLARGVLLLCQRGIYRAYVPRTEPTAVVRGRLNLAASLRQPTQPHLVCTYDQHTANLLANQLLAVALRQIAHSGLCGPAVWREVRRAQDALGLTHLPPLTAEDCDRVVYNRLNVDYRPWLALSRFFLSATGPAGLHGDLPTVPFLVNMSQLFERFVAGWLKRHAPPQIVVQTQPALTAGESLQVVPDLVLRERNSRQPLLVLDTKYKLADTAAPADLYQVAFYASNVLNCDTAVLIYPQPLARPLREKLAHVQLHSATFDLTAVDLAASGEQFWAQLTPLLPTLPET